MITAGQVWCGRGVGAKNCACSGTAAAQAAVTAMPQRRSPLEALLSYIGEQP
jgi:hypothetical protein